MRAPRTRATALPRRLTALGLAVWLAGAGCLLGCTASIGAAASAHHDAAHSQTHAARNESHRVERPDSCAAMSGHDCCGGEERETDEAEGRASAGAGRHGSGTAMHCPLGGRQASDPARKVRVDTTPTASQPATQSPAPESSYAAPPDAADALVRDRGGTYLRCCVFLI